MIVLTYFIFIIIILNELLVNIIRNTFFVLAWKNILPVFPEIKIEMENGYDFFGSWRREHRNKVRCIFRNRKSAVGCIFGVSYVCRSRWYERRYDFWRREGCHCALCQRQRSQKVWGCGDCRNIFRRGMCPCRSWRELPLRYDNVYWQARSVGKRETYWKAGTRIYFFGYVRKSGSHVFSAENYVDVGEYCRGTWENIQISSGGWFYLLSFVRRVYNNSYSGMPDGSFRCWEASMVGGAIGSGRNLFGTDAGACTERNCYRFSPRRACPGAWTPGKY